MRNKILPTVFYSKSYSLKNSFFKKEMQKLESSDNQGFMFDTKDDFVSFLNKQMFLLCSARPAFTVTERWNNEFVYTAFIQQSILVPGKKIYYISF